MESQTTKRCNDLRNLEMKFDFNNSYIGKESYNKDFNVAIVEIQCDNDTEWDLKIQKLSDELIRRKNNL